MHPQPFRGHNHSAQLGLDATPRSERPHPPVPTDRSIDPQSWTIKSPRIHPHTRTDQFPPITRVTLTPAYNPATSSRATTIGAYALLIGWIRISSSPRAPRSKYTRLNVFS